MTVDKIGSQTITPSNVRLQQVQAPDRSAMSLKDNQLMENKNVKKTTNESVHEEAVEEAVDKLNNFLEPVRRNLKFELHDKLDKYYVTVVDSDTSEVIKEIPPKKILDMYAAMAEFMGLLVDRKI